MPGRRKALAWAGELAGLFHLHCLRCKGYRLLTRGFKTPQGEKALSTRRRHVTAFIEVKAPGNLDWGIASRDPIAIQAHSRCRAGLGGPRQESQ